MNKKLALSLIAAAALLVSCGKIMFWRELKFTGTLEATEHNVGSRVTGRIAEVFVDEGSAVQRSKVIAHMDRYDQAARDLHRAEAVYKKGGLSEQDFEQAQLAFEDQQILSPVDGEVLIKVREEGEVIPAGAPIAVIADLHKMWVRVFVPEGQINSLRMGQEAKIKLDGVRKTYKGTITFIASQAEFTPRNVQTAEERVTQTFAVKVVIENPEKLRPGVAAEVIF